jgi:hypothetical protein
MASQNSSRAGVMARYVNVLALKNFVYCGQLIYVAFFVRLTHAMRRQEK